MHLQLWQWAVGITEMVAVYVPLHVLINRREARRFAAKLICEQTDQLTLDHSETVRLHQQRELAQTRQQLDELRRSHRRLAVAQAKLDNHDDEITINFGDPVIEMWGYGSKKVRVHRAPVRGNSYHWR